MVGENYLKVAIGSYYIHKVSNDEFYFIKNTENLITDKQKGLGEGGQIKKSISINILVLSTILRQAAGCKELFPPVFFSKGHKGGDTRADLFQNSLPAQRKKEFILLFFHGF